MRIDVTIHELHDMSGATISYEPRVTIHTEARELMHPARLLELGRNIEDLIRDKLEGCRMKSGEVAK